MRVTNQLTFANSIANTQGGQNTLYKIMQQLSSGLKIQNSYEDSSIYIDGTRLEYELKTLEQIKEATNSALELAKNTDKTINDMVKLIEDFKVLVTKAASDGNDQTSREAIAKELEKIRDNIINLANTSINGQYLFSGSQTSTKPFDKNGNYNGNDKNINVVTGAGTDTPYNIPGYDLFFKPDKDYEKQITTNVSFTDNRYDLINNPDKTQYLDENSPWKNLIGLNYTQDGKLNPYDDFEDKDKKLDFPPSTIFVQGTKPDGTTFKSAVNIKPEDTIGDVLDQIGRLYGNTNENKVVDVTINNSGQIQIKDLKEGNNKIDFHAVAFTPQFDNKAEYTQIKEAMAAANPPLIMSDLTNQVMQAAMAAPSNGNINNLNNPVTIQINGQNFDIDLSKTEFIKSNMIDSTNNTPADGVDYDNVYFEQNGNKVGGTVSQIIKGTNEYATDSTKLSEVMAGNSLNGTVLNLNITSKGGDTYNVSIDLGNSTVSYPDPNNAGQTITFPIMNTNPATGNSGVVTSPNDITYKQINDIIGMFASDNMPTATIPVNNGQIAANDYQNFQQLLSSSTASVEVYMDYEGKITIEDKLSPNTNIQVSMSDSASGVFPMPPYNQVQTNTGPNFVFSANNSLTIDEPNVDLIKDLDAMIEAVRNGNMRADANGADPRNTGMQGALERLDHLADHLRKQNTVIGAYENAIQQTNTRVTFLEVNVQSIKTNVTDADYEETLINLMQAQLAYQASMKASTMISQLSLLNYM